MAQAMYPYTFGIVSDFQGMEGTGLGTGVGVVWRGTYLIATAKHVVEDSPSQRVYYLLPQETLRVGEPSAPLDRTQVSWQPRCTLENPRILLGDGDFAVILLPEQQEPAASKHYYSLEESQATPALGATVGYMGYPIASRQPLGMNYGALPSYAFGDIYCIAGSKYDTRREFAVGYEPGDDLDPHGFSGSGVWHSGSVGEIWSPQISLAGLVTSYYRRSRVLICCRIQVLISFLKENNAALRA
jgi:hypothetical protein